jgi:hypothetical protein
MTPFPFRDAATRRFSLSSVVQGSCFGYARFHSFNTTCAIPFLFPVSETEPANRHLLVGRMIKAHFLGI